MRNFQVKRAFFLETARYDDIHLRPFNTNYNSTVDAILKESTDYGQNVNPTTLSAAASQFLRPSTVAQGVANISQGFQEKRISFLIEVVDASDGAFSGGTRYLFSGYTNHLGISNHSGTPVIDPDMLMYFNNIFQLRDVPVPTQHGVQIQTNVVDALHVLHGTNETSYMQQPNQKYSMRPEDVFAHLDFTYSPQNTGFQQNGGVYDNRLSITTPRLVHRSREIRSNYMNDTIKAYDVANDAQEIGEYIDDGDVREYQVGDTSFHKARNNVREKPMSNNDLMARLMTETNYTSMGCVTYSEMNYLLPSLDHCVEVFTLDGRAKATEYQPGQGENWRGSNYETIAASIVQQTLPALMADSLITKVELISHNDTVGQVYDDIRIIDVRGFTEGLDLSPYVNVFMDRLRREVLSDISHMGQVQYSIHIKFDLMHECSIKISLNNGPMILYVAPVFCDALYAPVVSGDMNTVQAVAHDIESVLQNYRGDISRMASEAQSMKLPQHRTSSV